MIGKIKKYIYEILEAIQERIKNQYIIRYENLEYLSKENPMTKTEQEFVKNLKVFTDKYNLIILPQVQLQSIFKTINNKDISSFNKIKSKSIDFAIVDNNYNYKLFIELDDYTHNRKDRINRDIFVNNLFNNCKLNFKRIKVKNNYDLEQIDEMIREIIQQKK